MNEDILRYLRQVVMKAMDHIRNRMRGSERLLLKEAIASSARTKAESNLTKGVDREAEDLVIDSLLKKLPRMKGVERLAVFSEEAGIVTHSGGLDPDGRLNRASLQLELDYFRNRGYYSGSVDLSAAIDTSFAEYAAQQLGPYR